MSCCVQVCLLGLCVWHHLSFKILTWMLRGYQWGVFGFGEEGPHPSGRAVDNDEVSGVSIVGCKNLVRRFILPFVVVRWGAHECKVDEELGPTGWDMFCGLLGGLFTNVCLLFEINYWEWMIFKDCGMPITLVGRTLSWCSPEEPRWSIQTLDLTCQAFDRVAKLVFLAGKPLLLDGVANSSGHVVLHVPLRTDGSSEHVAVLGHMAYAFACSTLHVGKEWLLVPIWSSKTAGAAGSPRAILRWWPQALVNLVAFLVAECAVPLLVTAIPKSTMRTTVAGKPIDGRKILNIGKAAINTLSTRCADIPEKGLPILMEAGG